MRGGGEESKGKRERLDYLCDELGLDPEAAGLLRYQLLHRTVSALIEARRFTARHALMLIHSFSPSARWLDEYIAFAASLGVLDAGRTRSTGSASAAASSSISAGAAVNSVGATSRRSFYPHELEPDRQSIEYV